MEEQNVQKKSVSGPLATVALIVSIMSIVLAVVLDIVAFKEAIAQFILALILPPIAFVVLCIAMVASCIFIFGILLLKEYGFWPFTLAVQFFKEMVGDIHITDEQLQLFRTFRIILIALCVAIIVVAVISKVLGSNNDDVVDEEYTADGKKKKKKDNSEKVTSTIAIVLAVLGLLVSIGAIVLTSQM